MSLRLRPALGVLGALFALTGCAGLLAEQCFEKLLTHLVGASTPAAALVLAAYFLGLTLGALLYGRFFAGARRPLRAYALLELAVAIWSVLLAAFSSPLIDALAPALRLGRDSFALLQTLRFGAACLWVLPPTLAMGATFPAIVDALEALRVPQPRRSMARFYTLNLSGAVAGALLGPYLVFPALGLHGTLLATFAVDAAAAAIALWLSTRLRFVAGRTPQPAPLQAPAPRVRLPLLLAACAFGSGFLSFALEVVWTHLISAVLGNSVYAFAAMLALVLIGLALGGAIASRLFGAHDRPVSAALPGGLLVLASLLLALQRAHWPEVPGFFLAHADFATGFWRGELLRWTQAALQLVPSATVLGMVYPLLFRLDAFPPAQRAASAARLSAWNSAGCVLGSLAAAFLLLPRFGSETLLGVLGVAALVAGVLLVLAYARGARRWLPAAAALGVAGLWIAQHAWNRLQLTSGAHVYFRWAHVTDNSKLDFFHEDAAGGITTVVERTDEGVGVVHTLLTNGKFQANDTGESAAQTGMALVPILHAPALDAALVIGLGSGHTAGVVAGLGFKHIDIAEIAPGMAAAADQWFTKLNHGVLHDARTSLRLEDGRNFLLLEDRRRFDLISIELSSLWYAGSCNLYSREFYRLAQRRLAPGGVLQQWVQVHHISLEEIGAVIATLRDTFAQVSFWLVGGQGVILASDVPQAMQPAPLHALLDVQGDLATDRLADLQDVLTSRLLAPADVDRMLAERRFHINTDGNRWLEYASPRYNLIERDLTPENIAQLSRWSSYAPPALAAGAPEAALEALQDTTPERIRTAFGIR